MKRIEIVEDGIDGSVSKMEKFMKNINIEQEKANRFEDALKEQIDLIHTLNEKLAAQQAHVDRFGEAIDNGLNRMRSDL